MFEHILVPLDGSTRAEAALPIAARIARAAGSSVVLLQVVSIPISSGYGSGPDMNYGYGGGMGMNYVYGGGMGMNYGYGGGIGLNSEYDDVNPGYSGALVSNALITEQDKDTERADAIAYLTRIAHSDQFAGITTTTEVVFGNPAPQILALMEKQGVNLVVMCSHGRTGFLRWVLGGVAQRIIHHSRVPVLILHEEGSTAPALHTDGVAHPFSIAVALDGSPLAETALLPAAHLAAALAPHTQGVIHLLNVVKPSMFAADSDIISQRDADEVKQAQAYLQRVRERLLTQTSDLNLLVTCSVTSAQDVAETIVTTTKNETGNTGENGCDVLAMATHGHGGIERWVMGSVTERVLGASTVPVLVVRPPQETLHA